MSASAPPQRAFLPSHAKVPAPPGSQLAAAAAVTHAALWLWAWVLRASGHPIGAPFPQVLFLTVFDGTAVAVYWGLSTWLKTVRRYRGADRYVWLCAALTLVDLVARAAAILRGPGAFTISTIPVLGSYGIMISYPHLQYFALGTGLIALGYSLLRVPDETRLLHAYAVSAIAMGMTYAGFLGNLSIVPGVAGDLLLARLLLPQDQRAVAPAAPRPSLGARGRART